MQTLACGLFPFIFMTAILDTLGDHDTVLLTTLADRNKSPLHPKIWRKNLCHGMGGCHGKWNDVWIKECYNISVDHSRCLWTWLTKIKQAFVDDVIVFEPNDKTPKQLCFT